MGNTGSSDVSKERKHRHHKGTPSRQQQRPSQASANVTSQARPASEAKPMEEPVKDVMISYSRTNSDIMTKLKASIEKEGISVWNDVTDLDAGADFLSKIGQAVIDCKVFLFLVSEKAIASKYCQDELALSYISNKAILPVGLSDAADLFANMDTGMRLQLARFEWYDFSDVSKFYDQVVPVIKRIKEVVGNKDENVVNTWFGGHSEDDDNKDESAGRSRGLNRQQSRHNVLNRNLSDGGEEDEINVMDEAHMNTFWERHFQENKEIPWFDFVTKFTKEYEKQINQIFKENKDKVWLISILHRELEVAANTLLKRKYDRFCMTANGRQPFWVRVQDQAVESYTIREVFNMESSVRVEAIENLGKFKSPPVIEALIDLLSDSDNNVKAVAAISLARTETNTPRSREKLLDCLDDKDRLVRESGCLALGHLKVQEAVPKLVQLWRNDFISTVREAASLALEQVGGEEANKAIHMTKVLSEEIKQLTATH